jgi:DNA repair exonuclease SbcCD nuclease subunit
MKKIIDKNKSIIFLGDIHGNWNQLLFKIKLKKISNANIISVGDLGVGFKPNQDMVTYGLLDKEFKQNNINFYSIRGNHDDPSAFKRNDRICLDNFELVEDYSVFEYDSKLIQLIGGAVSIDRTGRTVGVSYWENEGVVFNRDACKKVDILVTHTAPSFCAPQKFNEMVYGWAREDAYLLEDLTDERAVMDEIFKICSPKYHFYGHFHFPSTEIINECTHKLLDIDELFEFRELL